MQVRRDAEQLGYGCHNHKCSSIIRLQNLTNFISKQNENVQNSPSSDRKKERNVNILNCMIDKV